MSLTALPLPLERGRATTLVGAPTTTECLPTHNVLAPADDSPSPWGEGEGRGEGETDQRIDFKRIMLDLPPKILVALGLPPPEINAANAVFSVLFQALAREPVPLFSFIGSRLSTTEYSEDTEREPAAGVGLIPCIPCVPWLIKFWVAPLNHGCFLCRREQHTSARIPAFFPR